VKNVDGLQSVENREQNIFIKYYGDYWFHNLTRQTTLNWDRNFVKSIKFNRISKVLLYTAHTSSEPYCSTIGLLYKNRPLIETIKDITVTLKKIGAGNITTTTEIIGTGNYTLLSYELRNDQFKVTSKYLEYYSIQGKDVLRIIFWTTETGDNWLESEAKGIIESIESGI
jgi:hypothetical protein